MSIPTTPTLKFQNMIPFPTPLNYDDLIKKYGSVKQPDRSLFYYMSDSEKDNKELMISVIKFIPNCVQNASKRLKDDKDFILLAARHHSSNMYYASKRLSDDVDVMLNALVDSGGKLNYFNIKPRKQISPLCGYFRLYLKQNPSVVPHSKEVKNVLKNRALTTLSESKIVGIYDLLIVKPLIKPINFIDVLFEW